MDSKTVEAKDKRIPFRISQRRGGINVDRSEAVLAALSVQLLTDSGTSRPNEIALSFDLFPASRGSSGTRKKRPYARSR